jgi:pSer/pThr/pTyr-binding forkhead associated (FHA) protein
MKPMNKLNYLTNLSQFHALGCRPEPFGKVSQRMTETQHIPSGYSSEDETEAEDDVTLSQPKEVAYLRALLPNGPEQYALRVGRNLIGREKTTTDRIAVDIVIREPTLSRAHAAIEVNSDGMAFIEDLNSSNKTRLVVPMLHPNQTPSRKGKNKINSETILQPRRLYQVKHLDKIILGKTACEFGLSNLFDQKSNRDRTKISDEDTQDYSIDGEDEFRDFMETQNYDVEYEPKMKKKSSVQVLETPQPRRRNVSFGNDEVSSFKKYIYVVIS